MNIKFLIVLGWVILTQSHIILAENEKMDPCMVDFELSDECINAQGLTEKVEIYKKKIAESQRRLGTSYKIDLQVVGSVLFTVYNADPAFTTNVYDVDMRPQSFVIHVMADFLKTAPEILWEASSLHEIAHIMNDDLQTYHRNGQNIEVAEERVVMNLVGEEKYKEYLHAYENYVHWTPSKFDNFLQKVRNVKLVPTPNEIDEADREAAKYFESVSEDNTEHLLVWNGTLHDISAERKINQVPHDGEKLLAVIREGKPMIFIHNHPPQGNLSMFPSCNDYEVASFFTYLVWRENPHILVDFRVMSLQEETISVWYGLKKPILDLIWQNANVYRIWKDHETADSKQNELDILIRYESMDEYLQHVCPIDLTLPNLEICRTLPQYFRWPSDKYFLHYRGSIPKK